MSDTSRLRILYLAYGLLMGLAIGANVMVAADPAFRWNIWPFVAAMISMGLYLDLRIRAPVCAKLLVVLTFIGTVMYAIRVNFRHLSSVLMPEIILYTLFLAVLDLKDRGAREAPRSTPKSRLLHIQIVHVQILVILLVVAFVTGPKISIVNATIAALLATAQVLSVWVPRVWNGLPWLTLVLSLGYAVLMAWVQPLNPTFLGTFVLATLVFGGAQALRRSIERSDETHFPQTA